MIVLWHDGYNSDNHSCCIRIRAENSRKLFERNFFKRNVLIDLTTSDVREHVTMVSVNTKGT